MIDPTERAERLEDLACACMDRMAEEGPGVVERVCAEHPELAAELRGLLQQLTVAGLVELGGEHARTQTLGDFTLLRRLGAGGMGVVWLAEQRSLKRRVALKLLHPGFVGDAKSRARFEREVQALSRLDHPNVCTVYEAGEVEGTPYLAMRFVEGADLGQLIELRRRQGTSGARSARRELSEFLVILEKVARALHAAHEAGVVHRDVKPQNILVERSGEPVVVDFGLARGTDEAVASLTVTGQPVGTPAYMAPEQVSGKGAIDRRTDVYALGVTLYECATGVLPFVAASRESLYRAILHDLPPDPRTRDRAVGSELHAVIEKALQKRPEARFQSAADLADELGRICRHTPIVTRRPGAVLRALRACQRNKAATAIVATVSLALVVALSLLRRSVVAEGGFRALALIAASEQARREDPELSFKLAREALVGLGSDDPSVLAHAQAVMFELRRSKVVRQVDGAVRWACFSPDGGLVASAALGQPTELHRPDGTAFGVLSTRFLPRAHVAFSNASVVVGNGRGAGSLEVFELGANGLLPPLTLVAPDAQQVISSLTADGDRILTTFVDGSAHVLTLADLPLREIAASSPHWDGALLPDGGVVAASRLWRTDGGVVPLPGHASPVFRIEVGRECFATADSSGHLRLWTFAGELLAARPGRAQTRPQVHDLEFTPDGRHLVVAMLDGGVWLLDAATGQDIRPFGLDEAAPSVAVSRSGDRLAVSEFDTGRVQVWSLAGSRLLTLSGHQGGISAVEFAPTDDQRLLVASWDGSVRLWNLDGREDVPIVTGASRPTLVRTDEHVVVVSSDGGLLACDARGRLVRRARMPVENAASYGTLARDRHAVWLVSLRGGVWRWDPRSDAPPQAHGRPFSETRCWTAYELPNGTLLAGSESPRGPFVARPGEPREELELNGAACCVSRDGAHAYLATLDGRIVELDRAARRTGVVIDLPTRAPAGFLALSPDEFLLAVPADDRRVHLVDLRARAVVRSFEGHQHRVMTAAFSPDPAGSLIATASYDGTARIWDRLGARPPLVLRHPRAVESIAFVTQDIVVTSCVDGAVRWWAITAERAREIVGGVAVPPLTEAERARFPALFPR